MATAGQKRKKGEKTVPEVSTSSDSPLDLSTVPEEGFENTSKGTPSKKSKPKKPLDSRFGGKTEEEIMQLLLPDHLRPGLDIVFIGINPGLLSAYLGHHYCNANNHFWPCMYESGLIPRRMTYKEDAECLEHGIGFTNIVPRTTRSSNDLTRKEIKEWSEVMINRMKELRPLVACFNGKGIYEIFLGKKCVVGIQSQPLPDTDTVVYVMPSTSGRAASHPRRVDKLKFFHELKQLRDNLKAKRDGTMIPVTAVSTESSPGQHSPSISTQSSTSNSIVSTSSVVPTSCYQSVNTILLNGPTTSQPAVTYQLNTGSLPTPVIVSPYFHYVQPVMSIPPVLQQSSMLASTTPTHSTSIGSQQPVTSSSDRPPVPTTINSMTQL